MNSQMTNNKLVEEFIQVLDDDILNLELSLIRLDELRAAVIKREDDALKALIETIRIQSDDHTKVNRRRDDVLRRLSSLYGVKKVDITFIAGCVDDSCKNVLLEKQKKVKMLVEKMNVEYSATFMFMQEFSRMNKMLLNCFVRPANGSKMYDNKGKTKHDSGSNIISGRV